MVQVAVTLETNFTFDSTSGQSSTFTIASGEGLLVLITLEVDDEGKEVATVTWDLDAGAESLTNTDIAGFNPASHGKLRQEVWWLPNPTAGTDTITVTIAGGNAQKAGVVVLSVTDFDTGTPFDNRDTDDNASSTSGSISGTQAADDLGICVAGFFATASNFTPGGGEFEVVEQGVEGTFDQAVYTEDGSGSVTLSWNHGGSGKENSTLGFVINGVVVGGGGGRLLLINPPDLDGGMGGGLSL